MHASPTAQDFFLANFYAPGLFTCIFPNPSRVFPVLAVANTGSCVGPQNEIGHPAHHRQLIEVPLLSARGIWIGSKICVVVSLGLHFKIVSIILTFRKRLMCSIQYEMCCVVFVSLWNIVTDNRGLKKKKELVVRWLVDSITGRQIEACFQPGYNPLWLTGLKAPTN